MLICLSMRFLRKRQRKVLQGVLALWQSTPTRLPFFPSSFPSFQSNSSLSKKRGTKYLTKQILAAIKGKIIKKYAKCTASFLIMLLSLMHVSER